jgi:DNA invertase Pin-like site-specific DNA recombinase
MAINRAELCLKAEPPMYARLMSKSEGEMSRAIYMRTSGTAQDPENQLPDLLKASGEATQYIDQRSGKTEDRPQFLKMMADAKAGKFTELYIWALDRLSRGGIEATLKIVRELKERGVRVVSLKDAWLDTSHPCSDLVISVMAWAAEQERIRLSERMQAGRQRAKAAGVKLGRKPFVIGSHQLDARSMREDGHSYQEIAERIGCSKSAIARFFQEGK